MNQYAPAANRQQRSEQLLDLWSNGKKGQATVLSLCHHALPEGETLQAGMSIFDVILDHEFGPLPEDQAAYHRQSA